MDSKKSQKVSKAKGTSKMSKGLSWTPGFRSNLHSLSTLIKELNLKQHHWDKMLKFSPFYHMFYAIHLNEDLNLRKMDSTIEKLIKSYNPNNKMFRIGGVHVPLTRSDFDTIFGIVCGRDEVNMKVVRDRSSCEYVGRHFSGCKSNNLTLKLVKDTLKNLVNSEEEVAVDDVVRLLNIFSMGSVFFASKGEKIPSSFLYYANDLEKMKNYDWSSTILANLMNSIHEKHANPCLVVGCVSILPYWFNEHTTCFEPRSDKLPRFMKWDVSKAMKFPKLTSDQIIVGELVWSDSEELFYNVEDEMDVSQYYVEQRIIPVPEKENFEVNLGEFLSSPTNIEMTSKSIDEVVADLEKLTQSDILEERDELQKEVHELKSFIDEERQVNIEISKENVSLKMQLDQLTENKDNDILEKIAEKEDVINSERIKNNDLAAEINKLREKLEDMVEKSKYNDLLKSFSDCKEDIDAKNKRIVVMSEENRRLKEEIAEIKEKLQESSGDILMEKFELENIFKQNIKDLEGVVAEKSLIVESMEKELALQHSRHNDEVQLLRKKIHSMTDELTNLDMLKKLYNEKERRILELETEMLSQHNKTLDAENKAIKIGSLERRVKERPGDRKRKNDPDFQYEDKNKKKKVSDPVEPVTEIISEQCPAFQDNYSATTRAIDERSKSLYKKLCTKLTSGDGVYYTNGIHVSMLSMWELAHDRMTEAGVLDAYLKIMKDKYDNLPQDPNSSQRPRVDFLYCACNTFLKQNNKVGIENCIDKPLLRMIKMQVRYILVPMHASCYDIGRCVDHWTLLVVDTETGDHVFYNSLKARGSDPYAAQAKKMFTHITNLCTKGQMNETQPSQKPKFIVLDSKNTPQQKPGSVDCGICVMMEAEEIFAGGEVSKSYEDGSTSAYRAKIFHAILNAPDCVFKKKKM